jgi:hypothetical protein
MVQSFLQADAGDCRTLRSNQYLFLRNNQKTIHCFPEEFILDLNICSNYSTGVLNVKNLMLNFGLKFGQLMFLEDQATFSKGLRLTSPVALESANLIRERNLIPKNVFLECPNYCPNPGL